MSVTIKVKKLRPHAKLPEFKTTGAAGADLYAAFDHASVAKPSIGPGETKLIETGISVEIPEGYEMQIRSRSGLAVKGLFVTNGPGTIDSDYRGEVKVILTNTGEEIVYIGQGDRIAQAVISALTPTLYREVEELIETERSEGGFGSTGA